MKNWTEEQTALFIAKVEGYLCQEKENVSYSYLVNLLSRIEAIHALTDEEMRLKVMYVIKEMPFKIDGKSLKYDTKHLNEISNLQTFVNEKYGLMQKGAYKQRFVPLGIGLGMALGVSVGLVLGNTALGIGCGMPIGIGIALLYGNYMDNVAEKEHRTL
jgi:hypothetical protein